MWLNENMSQITDGVQPSKARHSDSVLLGRPNRPQSRGEWFVDLIPQSISALMLSAVYFFCTLESIREETCFARTTVGEAVKLLPDRGVLMVKPGRYGGLLVAKATPL